MTHEINRILKLYADLEHGECWIGTNFKEVLHDVTAESAQRKIDDSSNNIWQLVSHLIYWRATVVNRLTGSTNPPPFMDFRLPETLTAETWKQTMLDFEAAYHSLRTAIHALKDEALDRPSPKEGQTFYQLIMGSLQHDAYHLGQMRLLKKLSADF